MKKNMQWITGLLIAVLIVIPDQTVLAQTLIEEITVTARQREELLRDVPASITVLTDSQLERSGVQRATDFIALTPGAVSYTHLTLPTILLV